MIYAADGFATLSLRIDISMLLRHCPRHTTCHTCHAACHTPYAIFTRCRYDYAYDAAMADALTATRAKERDAAATVDMLFAAMLR